HWAGRNMTGPYYQHGKRDPKWDNDAITLMKESVALWMQAPELKTSAHTPVLSQKILAAGCDDPLLLFLASRAQYGNLAKRRELLSRAIDGFPTAAYPPIFEFLARSDWYNLAHSQNASQR